MVSAHRRSLAILLAAVIPLGAFAQDELKPRPARLRGDLTVAQILKELHEQTGNPVADLRKSNRDNPKLTLKTGSFWETLDALGEKTGIGFSAYQDGGVALVDAPYRKLKVHHSGLFRFAVKRISVTRDDEAQSHHCHLTLDAAWEPRFAALFISLDGARVVYDTKKRVTVVEQEVERQSARNVAGANATEIDLRMIAPERTTPRLTLVKGSIKMIGAPRMLEFAFDKVGPIDAKTPRALKQEGVTVRLTEVKQLATRWSVKLEINNPPGAIVPLESFQSWLDNNRLWLTWTDPNTKKAHALDPIGEAQEGTSEEMKIHFNFTAREGTPLPAKGAEVTLRYRTPYRVVAFTAPFEFNDVPLP